MSDALVSVELDQKALARETARLKGLTGKGVADKLNRGTLSALKILAPSVRAAAPVGRTRKLRGNVKVFKARRSGPGAVLAPENPVRHLVIRPHRIVTPGGRDTGRRTTGNPFIDRAAEPRMQDAMNEVQKALFDD